MSGNIKPPIMGSRYLSMTGGLIFPDIYSCPKINISRHLPMTGGLIFADIYP
jgi:hypothetical protein